MDVHVLRVLKFFHMKLKLKKCSYSCVHKIKVDKLEMLIKGGFQMVALRIVFMCHRCLELHGKV